MPHAAWTFDPSAFHEWLESQIIERDALRMDRLEAVVRKLIDEWTSTAMAYLTPMRLDPDSNEDVQHLFDLDV